MRTAKILNKSIRQSFGASKSFTGLGYEARVTYSVDIGKKSQLIEEPVSEVCARRAEVISILTGYRRGAEIAVWCDPADVSRATAVGIGFANRYAVYGFSVAVVSLCFGIGFVKTGTEPRRYSTLDPALGP